MGIPGLIGRIKEARKPIGHKLDPRLRSFRRAHCSGRWACDLANLRLPEFTSGARLGTIGVLIGWTTWVLFRRYERWRLRPLPIGGLIFTCASLEALRETGHLVSGIVIANALLVFGGAVAHVLDLGAVWRGVLAAPGVAVLLAGAGLVNPGWSRAFIGVVVFLAAVSLQPFERRCHEKHINPGMVLLAISVVGLYEAVPDPDLALVLLGVSLPLLLVGWPLPAASLGGAGWAAFGLLGWEAGVGGTGRLSAVIGGVGCLALFVAEPIATAFRRDGRSFLDLMPSGAAGTIILGLVQLPIVYVASRVAGTNPEHSAKIAVLIVTADLGLSALGLSWIAGRAPSRATKTKSGP